MKPDSAPVPEDSIRVYYERHPLEFTVPARARVRHILIALPPRRSRRAPRPQPASARSRC